MNQDKKRNTSCSISCWPCIITWSSLSLPCHYNQLVQLVLPSKSKILSNFSLASNFINASFFFSFWKNLRSFSTCNCQQYFTMYSFRSQTLHFLVKGITSYVFSTIFSQFTCSCFSLLFIILMVLVSCVCPIATSTCLLQGNVL